MAAALCMAALPSYAADKSVGSGANPYSDCGIGAALFPNTNWAAVTSNVIWDLGTTAVISAVSSPETCSARKVNTAKLILDTYDKLAEETASGEGKHLTAVLNTFGCDPSLHGRISQDVRANMADQVANPDYTKQPIIEKSTHYYRALDAAAAGQCIG
ncbi:MAG: DUF3015 family protein [Magnetococcales bacterium]|nr:DUF3015 family protein [Magnetococcales bacterium]